MQDSFILYIFNSHTNECKIYQIYLGDLNSACCKRPKSGQPEG